MNQLTQSQRKLLEEVFNDNEYIERNIMNCKQTTKDREKQYLEDLKENPNLELPSVLNLNTITGIEEQIKKLNSEDDSFTTILYLKQNREKAENGDFVMTIEKLELGKTE